MKRTHLILRMMLYLGVYFALSYYGGEVGRKILYPLRILVCFLHESGHALATLITGGSVDSIQINADGSGWTRSSGGSRSLIIMGGYIGSAIFGNVLFYLGARWKKSVSPVLYILAASMLFSAVFWFNSIVSSLMLIFFGLVLIWIAGKGTVAREVLMFIGLISIIYIIQDFDVGPSSDLEAYAKELVILPPLIWKYIWLGVVLLLFIFNLGKLFKNRQSTKN